MLAGAERAEASAHLMVRVNCLLGVCATLAVFFQSAPHGLGPYVKAVSFMSFLCPAIAAAIVGFANKSGFLYEAKHYSRMLAVYREPRAKLPGCTADSVRRLASALGEEALLVNGEWALFRRERAIDEPASPFKKPW